MKVPALLKNKYVCYALMALATLNVIGYVTVRAWECLALFALAGYSCYCYCKNKSCSILAALFIANFVFGCGRVKEGFEDAFKGPVEHLEDSATSAATGADQLEENPATSGTPASASASDAAAAALKAAAMAAATDQASCVTAGGATYTDKVPAANGQPASGGCV
jgi:hypothetical protein